MDLSWYCCSLDPPEITVLVVSLITVVVPLDGRLEVPVTRCSQSPAAIAAANCGDVSGLSEQPAMANVE